MSREPYKRRDGDANLPIGNTCEDCVHFPRCFRIHGHIALDEVCEWTPSKFRRAADAAGDEQR